MKSVLFWLQIVMICIAFLFCGVGMQAVDEWLVHDLQSIAPQKTSLLAGLMGAFGVCALAWTVIAFAERMFEEIRANDPDFAYDFDEGEGDAFPDSPKKPR